MMNQQGLTLLRVRWFHERKRLLEDMQARIMLQMEIYRDLDRALDQVMKQYHAYLLEQIKQSSCLHFEDWHEEILDALADDDLLQILDNLSNTN